MPCRVPQRPEVVGDIPERGLAAVQRLEEDLEGEQTDGTAAEKLAGAAQRQQLGALDVHLEDVQPVESTPGQERVQRDRTHLDRHQHLDRGVVVTHVAHFEQRVRPAVR